MKPDGHAACAGTDNDRPDNLEYANVPFQECNQGEYEHSDEYPMEQGDCDCEYSQENEYQMEQGMEPEHSQVNSHLINHFYNDSGNRIGIIEEVTRTV